MFALFVTSLIPITVFSSCQYFQFPVQDGYDTIGLGPAIPCGVCLEAQGTNEYDSYSVSYDFECRIANNVVINGYDRSKCKGEKTPSNPFYAYSHSSGGICDHVTFKSYLANPNHDEGKSCIKQDQAGYFEIAFVTQCWSSLINPQYSAKLDCSNTDYFTLTGYKDPNCGGDVIGNMSAKIYAGCQGVNASSSLIPKNISNLFPNIPAFSSNETYFEITECGGGFPLWAIILIVVASVLCCCGCIGVAVWFCCCQKRKRSGIKTGYVQTTYGEGY